MKKIPSSEITPKHVYLNRKEFMKATAIAGASAVLAACSPNNSDTGSNNTNSFPNSSSASAPTQPTINEEDYSWKTDELGYPVNAYTEITNYNNFYEFALDKESIAHLAKDLITSPWNVEVGGLVNNPKTYGLEELLAFEQEERIYRLRCVEAWSMVIPWVGFPLHKLLAEVEPTSNAKYVRFETLLDPDQMPNQRRPWFDWPYVEGLRLDEAMNDLAILATGLYGEDLPPQNGAPIRLVVPWKYGFKSIKSIVKIELVDEMPVSLWMDAAPNEYGFYANVNPNVSHPRWSQSTERRIGEFVRRDTLLFNGYEEEVSYLYEGMDLRENY